MVGFEFEDTVIQLILLPACSPDRKRLDYIVHDFTTTGPKYTTRYNTRSTLATYGSRMDCCTLRLHPKLI
ncbi:hypothetical protein TNCV_1313651 [Trichonephila clavipes]|nr:hypothetical protein TNCV_1313651 [Trichonephila clavipes]